jgi:hypothetical protein
MQITQKKLAARESWLRLELSQYRGKAARAMEKLIRAYWETQKEWNKSGGQQGFLCKAKTDRIVLTTDQFPWQAFQSLPGYRFRAKRTLWGNKKLYGIAQPIAGTGTVREIIIEHDRKTPWVAPFRLTITPKDCGLECADLAAILELLPTFEIMVLEIALDFAEALSD